MKTINAESERKIIIKTPEDFKKYDFLKSALGENAHELNNLYRIDYLLLLNEYDMNAFFEPFPKLLEKGIKQNKTGTFRYNSKGKTRIPSSQKMPIFLDNNFNPDKDWTSQLEKIKIIATIDYVVLTSIQTLTEKELRGDGYFTREEALLDNQKYYPNLKMNSQASFYAFKEAYTNMSLKEKKEFLGVK